MIHLVLSMEESNLKQIFKNETNKQKHPFRRFCYWRNPFGYSFQVSSYNGLCGNFVWFQASFSNIFLSCFFHPNLFFPLALCGNTQMLKIIIILTNSVISRNSKNTCLEFRTFSSNFFLTLLYHYSSYLIEIDKCNTNKQFSIKWMSNHLNFIEKYAINT